MRSPPRAFTLPELIVAMGVGGVAFGAFALVVAREERAHAELARRLRAQAQMREGITPLAADLRAVSPAAGDIPAGGVRDSSIEFRSTVGTAVICELRGRSLLTGLASFVGAPHAGDTAWVYVESDGSAEWVPLATAGLQTVPADAPAACPFPPFAMDLVDAARVPRPRYALMLDAGGDAVSTALTPGSPIRVSRPVRYSLYRAPDGGWYLGRREWSAARGRFESVQPVSGPYRAYAPADQRSSGLQLEYFDAQGVPVPSGAADTRRIARIVVTVRAPPAGPSGDPHLRPADVASVSVAFRNRP